MAGGRSDQMIYDESGNPKSPPNLRALLNTCANCKHCGYALSKDPDCEKYDAYTSWNSICDDWEPEEI